MQKSKNVQALGLATGVLLAGGLAAFTIFKNRRTIPKGVRPVKPFDLDRYLGHWYELARFDFRFEKGLSHTTANYSKNEDGSVKVVNSGRKKDGSMKTATGKALPAGPANTAMLKVSFFGPFYAGYNVISIDEEYRYALVCGDSRRYLWILSREKTIPEDIREAYLQKAQALGFNTQKLLWPAQD